VRHRPCSFAQESTRYVNYKDGLNISLPNQFYEKPEEVQGLYREAFEFVENVYRNLIESGETPQQARAVLPNALKTEIVVTANLEEWNHIINLRYHGTTGAPHPDIKVVAEKIYNILKKNKMVGGLVAEV
jgi:thymidylate synthase (FAD)